MKLAAPWAGFDTRSGLLIDTNLLVLFVVGTVNPDRIESFKRTRKYDRNAFRLLVRVMGQFTPLYTLAHVMAEVSNLTDLEGPESIQARGVLKEAVTVFQEPVVSSARAVQEALYERLGLTDSAIAVLAAEQKCVVLTDDFDLYIALSREGIAVLNFSHLRATAWRLEN